MEEKKILEVLNLKFPGKVREYTSVLRDEAVVVERDSLPDIMKLLKNEPQAFAMLLDLTCVDYLGSEPRFEMVYHLFSLSRNRRLRVKVKLDKKDLRIGSLTALWKNANWLEREVYDLFGVHFDGHPDLRRIFMYDGFEGYPLRKDYPLRKRQPRMRLRK